MTVYLLHLDRRVNPDHPARHYMGSAKKLLARLDKHCFNPDARLMQVAKERGIGFALARTWPGGREVERKLKRRKEGPRLCPICRGEKPFRRYDPTNGGINHEE